MSVTLGTKNHVPPSEEGHGVRERLLQVATELFVEKGYASTSVREIVEAAGVTKPTLYYHFENKEGLFLALMRPVLGEFQALLTELQAAPGSPWERLKKLCLGVFLFCEERRPMLRLVYSLYYGPPQGAPEFDYDASFHILLEAIEDLVRVAVDAGEMRAVPIEDTALAILAVTDTSMEIALNHPERKMTAACLERQIDLLFEGLRPDQGEKP
jgi:TetR/AcrR family transcriptional regulator